MITTANLSGKAGQAPRSSRTGVAFVDHYRQLIWLTELSDPWSDCPTVLHPAYGGEWRLGRGEPNSGSVAEEARTAVSLTDQGVCYSIVPIARGSAGGSTTRLASFIAKSEGTRAFGDVKCGEFRCAVSRRRPAGNAASSTMSGLMP